MRVFAPCERAEFSLSNWPGKVSLPIPRRGRDRRTPFFARRQTQIARNPLIPLGDPLSIGSRSKQSDRFGPGTDKSSLSFWGERTYSPSRTPDPISMLFRSACAVRPCRVQSPSLGLPERARCEIVPSSAEILSEEPHHDERVESETAIAQQIPNFHKRSKREKTAGPRLCLGPARHRSQPGCERRQPAFSQTSPRELARKRSREAASPASKLENAEIRAPGRYLAICSSH